MNIGERLIVAADFKPSKCGGVKGARQKMLDFARSLEGTGVVIKGNSILRHIGYGLIAELHDMGLGVCADLKLVDIPETLSTDGEFLADAHPEIVTVMCDAEVDGMSALKAMLPKTEVLGVTVLTSFDEETCQQIKVCSSKAGVLRLARLAQLAGVDGLILSPQENEVIRRHKEIKLSLNNPGIRPKWSIVEGDDQKRVATIIDAFKTGASRVVIGRPITGAADPKEAVKKSLAEIEAALAA